MQVASRQCRQGQGRHVIAFMGRGLAPRPTGVPIGSNSRYCGRCSPVISHHFSQYCVHIPGAAVASRGRKKRVKRVRSEGVASNPLSKAGSASSYHALSKAKLDMERRRSRDQTRNTDRCFEPVGQPSESHGSRPYMGPSDIGKMDISSMTTTLATKRDADCATYGSHNAPRSSR